MITQNPGGGTLFGHQLLVAGGTQETSSGGIVKPKQIQNADNLQSLVNPKHSHMLGVLKHQKSIVFIINMKNDSLAFTCDFLPPHALHRFMW